MVRSTRKIILATALTVTPTTAFAQEIGDTSAIVVAPQLERSDAAGSRKEPGFSSEPIKAGPFLLEPSISLVGGYDSNVFNREDGDGDVAANLTPKLRARLDTPQHLIQFDAVGHFRRFLDQSTENSEEFKLGARARFDLATDSSVFANGSYGRLIEARSSVGSIANAAEPISYDLSQVQIGTQIGLGALWIRPELNFSQSEYQSIEQTTGTTRSLAFRDTRRYGGSLAAGYQISGLVSTFVRGSYSDSESITPLVNAARDAKDWSLVAGIKGEVTPLVFAEISAGYRKRDYDLVRFRDYKGATISADVQWFATPLMTFRLQADQDFINSGNEQVAGILSNRLQLSGYYDPLRNLRVETRITYEHLNYRDTDTKAQRPAFRMSAQYFLNPNVSLGAFAGVRKQSVSGAALVRPFTSFSTGVGITFTP